MKLMLPFGLFQSKMRKLFFLMFLFFLLNFACAFSLEVSPDEIFMSSVSGEKVCKEIFKYKWTDYKTGPNIVYCPDEK